MQIYNEEKNYINNNAISYDWSAIIDDCWMGIRRFWMLFVMVVLLCANLFYVYKAYTYNPVYIYEKIYSVSATNHTVDDMGVTLARRLSASFDATMKYSGLKQAILDHISDDLDEIPATIEVTNVQDTDLLTIRISADNIYNAKNIMNLFEKVFPDYANNIVGNVRLEPISATVPDNKNTVFPKNEVMLEGIIAGAIICVVWLMYYVLSRKTIRTPEVMKGITSLECLQGIPEVRLKKRSSNTEKEIRICNRIVGEEFKTQIATLRRKVIYNMKENKKQVLLVTSSVAKEGKTLVSCNLALSMAEAGYKVAFLGLNWRGTSQYYMKRNEWSISDVISGKVDIKEKFVEKTSDLVVIKMEKESITDIIGSGRLKKLLDYLKKEVDFVIIDSMPLISIEDTSAILEYVDKVLYVVRQDHVYKKDVEDGLELLTSSGSDVIGYVLNYAEASLTENAKYGYGRYGYGKYGKYGKNSVEIHLDVKDEKRGEEK